MPTYLNHPSYMKFPLRIGPGGARASTRAEHVREQIEQVLFTVPGERWYRPGFGAAVRQLVFEPGNALLVELTKKRINAALVESLAGEITPSSLEVEVAMAGAQLIITIRYQVATINHSERVEFAIGGT